MRRPGRPLLDVSAEPAYPGLKAHIIARTGHAYYADKDDLLLERLYRRLRATGVSDLAAYHTLLGDQGAGEAEWARLEAEITIGETFFFRYGEQFTALRSTILPDLVASRAAERSLRIWSAGCSTGAEPYSLAILVRELLGEALADWRVSILGTDISAQAIATAQAAEYGRWALRTMPPDERPRYFTNLPPEPGLRREGGFALRPEFRGMVRFKQGNLLRVLDPAGPDDAYDLILCRNVLIYFDAATVARVVHGLGRRLRPAGWLLLGHAEPNPTFAAFLDPVSLPGTVAYRPTGQVSAGVPSPPIIEPPALGVFLPLSPPGEPPPVILPAALPVPEFEDEAGHDPAPDDAEDAVARVRALADAGETGAAWRAVREALQITPMNAVLRFYEGLIAASLGREAEAERALRATLYLDRGFVMAHYHLGLLLLGQGRHVEAARALDNAVSLSQALPPDAVLPEGDGALASDVVAGVSAALGRSGETMRGLV